MTVEEFAKVYKLKADVDECDDWVIRGRYGDIGEYSKKLFVALFWGSGSDAAARKRRIAATAESGYASLSQFHIVPGCDEAAILFDPKNKKEARWFVKKIGCKRALSTDRRKALLQTLEKARATRTLVKKNT